MSKPLHYTALWLVLCLAIITGYFIIWLFKRSEKMNGIRENTLDFLDNLNETEARPEGFLQQSDPNIPPSGIYPEPVAPAAPDNSLLHEANLQQIQNSEKRIIYKILLYVGFLLSVGYIASFFTYLSPNYLTVVLLECAFIFLIIACIPAAYLHKNLHISYFILFFLIWIGYSLGEIYYPKIFSDLLRTERNTNLSSLLGAGIFALWLKYNLNNPLRNLTKEQFENKLEKEAMLRSVPNIISFLLLFLAVGICLFIILGCFYFTLKY